MYIWLYSSDLVDIICLRLHFLMGGERGIAPFTGNWRFIRVPAGQRLFVAVAAGSPLKAVGCLL